MSDSSYLLFLLSLSHQGVLRRVNAHVGVNVRMRVGVHVGEVVTGVVGRTRPRFHVYGPAVLTAERMEQSGQEGRIHCSPEAEAAYFASEFGFAAATTASPAAAQPSAPEIPALPTPPLNVPAISVSRPIAQCLPGMTDSSLAQMSSPTKVTSVACPVDFATVHGLSPSATAGPPLSSVATAAAATCDMSAAPVASGSEQPDASSLNIAWTQAGLLSATPPSSAQDVVPGGDVSVAGAVRALASDFEVASLALPGE